MRSHGFERHIAPQPSVSLPSSPPSMDHVGRPALDAYTTLYTASSVCIHLQNLVDVYPHTRTHTGWFTSACPYLTGVNRKEALKQTNRQILHSFTVNEHTFRRLKILLKRIEQFSRSETMDSYIFHVIARNELSKCSSYALRNYNATHPSPPFTFHPLVYQTRVFWITLYTCIHAQIEYVYTWPSVECHAIPFPSRRGQRGKRGSRGLLHPLRSLPRPPLLRPSILLASVGGAVTSDLPLPARLTDDSTPSHMQGLRARLDTLPRCDIDVAGSLAERGRRASKGISGNWMLLGTLRFEVGPLGGWSADGRVARFDGGSQDERSSGMPVFG